MSVFDFELLSLLDDIIGADHDQELYLRDGFDESPFAPLLKALPSASEEVRRIAEALLRGYGDIQFYTSPGYRKTVFTWTQRDKEA